MMSHTKLEEVERRWKRQAQGHWKQLYIGIQCRIIERWYKDTSENPVKLRRSIVTRENIGKNHHLTKNVKGPGAWKVKASLRKIETQKKSLDMKWKHSSKIIQKPPKQLKALGHLFYLFSVIHGAPGLATHQSWELLVGAQLYAS